jgi:hypothetical protein
MAEMKEAPAGASLAVKSTVWLQNRFPTVFDEYRKHMSEYYAPKNFNVWYFFGSLAMLVLVIQIVTGIFLTMHYKPDAATAFASVEYIMREVPGGWIIRYMHSTGASAFFIVVYLHMYRGLIYGSYRKPRELVWIFGCAIFLCLMAEAFFGYLLPWGQMSYWGAQVIVNLFAAVPFVGPDLALLIRGDVEPLLRLPRDCRAAGAAGAGGGAPAGAARRRFEQPGWRGNQGQEGCTGHPAGRHPVPSVLHRARHARGVGVPAGVLRDSVLRT